MKERLNAVIETFSGGNIRDFAAATDTNKDVIYQYLSGFRNPGNKFKEKLRKLGVSLDWFESGLGSMMVSKAKGSAKGEPEYDKHLLKIPLIENITCGVPIISQIDEESFMRIYEVTMRNKNIIAVKAQGDSMREYIRPNDILLCYKMNRDEKIKQNKAYVVDFMKAAVGSKEGVCKLVHDLDKDSLMLLSINTYYEPIIVRKEEVRALYKVYKIIRAVS